MGAELEGVGLGHRLKALHSTELQSPRARGIQRRVEFSDTNKGTEAHREYCRNSTGSVRLRKLTLPTACSFRAQHTSWRTRYWILDIECLFPFKAVEWFPCHVEHLLFHCAQGKLNQAMTANGCEKCVGVEQEQETVVSSNTVVPILLQ